MPLYPTVLGELVKNSIELTEKQKESFMDYTLYHYIMEYIDKHIYISADNISYNFLLYLGIRKSYSDLFRELKRLIKYRISRIFRDLIKNGLIIKYNNKTYKKIDSKK